MRTRQSRVSQVFVVKAEGRDNKSFPVKKDSPENQKKKTTIKVTTDVQSATNFKLTFNADILIKILKRFPGQVTTRPLTSRCTQMETRSDRPASPAGQPGSVGSASSARSADELRRPITVRAPGLQGQHLTRTCHQNGPRLKKERFVFLTFAVDVLSGLLLLHVLHVLHVCRVHLSLVFTAQTGGERRQWGGEG